MNKSKRKLYYAFGVVAVIAGLLFWQLGGVDYLTGGDSAGAILTITYADGTEQILDSKNYANGLEIRASGYDEAISSIKVELYVTVDYTGGISTFELDGTLNTKIIKSTGVEVYNSGNVALQKLSPAPYLVKGVPTVVTSATITASQLENLISNKVSGEYYRIYWACPSDLSLTINFADGTTQTKTKPVTSLYLLVQYTSGSNFNSLSATFYKTIYT